MGAAAFLLLFAPGIVGTTAVSATFTSATASRARVVGAAVSPWESATATTPVSMASVVPMGWRSPVLATQLASSSNRGAVRQSATTPWESLSNPNAPLPLVHSPTFVRVDATQTFVTLTSDPARARMTQIIQRRVGETGSALTGTLDNENGTLASTIPVGSDVRLVGTRTDTGQVVINGAPVQITDWPTLAFAYAFQAADVATACTLELVFKITRTDLSIVDDPNFQHYRLFLKIIP